MADQLPETPDNSFLLERKSFIKDLLEQIHDLLVPPKQPELVLESKPIPVKDIWSPRKPLSSRLGSVAAHLAVLGILMLPFWRPVRTQIQKVVTNEIFVPAPPDTTPAPRLRRLSGGGAPRPTPKLVVVTAPKPVAVAAPTAIIPVVDAMNLPSFGAVGPVAGPPGAGGGANGGSGGNGSGDEGGNCVGANCGTGGIAATAPVAVFSPDPEYSDEARKAKFQGTCTVEVEIDAQGHVHNPHVTGPLGLGLDQKAVEAVLKWRFIPAKDKNGRPIASLADIQVNFRLY